jgi:hypothetical protein
MAGASIRAAAATLRPSAALETLYHLLSRLRRRLDAVRCRLCQRQRAPVSSQSDPLRQTAEHLQAVFAASLCPLAAFQLSFQQPLLG